VTALNGIRVGPGPFVLNGEGTTRTASAAWTGAATRTCSGSRTARRSSIVWVAPSLGLWGAIWNLGGNLGWKQIDAWHTTDGICEDRPAGHGLVFKSTALRILKGRYGTVSRPMRAW